MAKYLQNSTDIEINESGDNLQFTMVKTKLLNLIYPVGSIYMSTTNTNPGSTLGGTWEAWGSGKVPVGIDLTDTDFDTVGKTGGSKKLQSHQHTLKVGWKNLDGGGSFPGYTSQASGAGVTTLTTENSGEGNSGNLQPYIVCYMWKRTA